MLYEWFKLKEKDTNEINLKAVKMVELIIKEIHYTFSIEVTNNYLDLQNYFKENYPDFDAPTKYYVDFLIKEGLPALKNLLEITLKNTEQIDSTLTFYTDTILAEINYKNKSIDTTIITIIDLVSNLDVKFSEMNKIQI